MILKCEGEPCMDTEKRLKKISDHFKNISIEQLEENFVKAGINEIRPASESGYKMVTEDEIKRRG